MPVFDPVIFHLSAMVRELVHREVWRESVKRGARVDTRDPVVLDRVCALILERGQQMREAATRLAYGPRSARSPAARSRGSVLARAA